MSYTSRAGINGPVRVLCKPRFVIRGLFFLVKMVLILESPPSCAILPSQMLRRKGLVKTVSNNSMKTKTNNKKSGVAKEEVTPKSLSITTICFREKITFYELKLSASNLVLFLQTVCFLFNN